MLERIYCKCSKRIMALLLAVCMVISMSPPMMAAAVTDSGEPVVLSGFAELPENIREQSVPIGTSSVELNLPSTLEATVHSVSEDTDTVPPVETPAPGTPAPPAEESETTPPHSQPQDSGTVETPSPSAPEETSEPQTPKESAPPADEAENVDGSEPVTQVLSAYVESDVAVTVSGVTWQSDPLYDGEMEGEYIFTAVLPNGYTMGEGVALPKIAVTVESAVDRVIAMIDALPTMDEWTAMDETAARAVMDEILAAKKAYDALTAEEKAQIDETRTAKLTELAEMAEQLANTMPMADEVNLIFELDTPSESGDGYEWVLDTKTLTLTDFDHTTNANVGIQLPDDATLVLNGANSLTVTGATPIANSMSVKGNYGIFCGDESRDMDSQTLYALTIEGSGTLAVTCAYTGAESLSYSWGIKAKSITMNGGTVTCTGDKASDSYGVLAEDAITINGGSLSGISGDATNFNYGVSTKINPSDGSVTGSITVNGGTLKGTGETGVTAFDLTVDGGSVIGVGKGDDSQNVGVVANNDLTINSGTITGTAEDCTDMSVGVGAANTLTVNGGTLAATSGTASMSIAVMPATALTTGEGVLLKCNTGANTGYAEEANFALVGGGAPGMVFEGADQTTIATDVKIYNPTLAAPVVNVTDGEIYAGGMELKIIASASAWSSNSNILYDKDGNGAIGDTEYLKIGDEEPTAEGYELEDYKVFGGKKGGSYTGNTKITMTGGNVRFIYGGGKKGTVTGNTSIVIEGGDVFSLYGAGYEDAGNTDAITVDGNTSVSITGGYVSYLYGGGENGKMTGNTTVAISGTANVNQRAYGGGNNDIVGGNATVNMTGGNVGHLYGEGDIHYNGTKVSGTVAITITGGKIYGYVAIDSDNVNTGSTLTIGGGADISASYGGIIIKSAQDNTGVESFAISPALTGADGSISVCLTADTFVEDAIIATGAVAGDAAKITITSMSGIGIDGKEAYFDSSDNTIKMRSSFQKTDISDKLTISIGGGWGYGETAKTPSVTATGVTIDQSKLTYTYSGTANDGTTLTDSTTPPTLPGSYTVTASYEDDTQKGAATVSFTVAKAPLTITGGTVTSRGYIAGDKTATVTAVTFSGLKNGETLAIITDYTVTGAEFADANVGTNKPVTATVALKLTAKTANYTLSNSQLNTTGTITQEADGTKNPDYAAAKVSLDAVHIITNVTPTLGDVTLPASWSFTGDSATRLAGIEGQANQNFAVKYTSQNPNYPDVAIAAQAFPVTTVLMDVQSGLSMVTLNKDEVKDIAPVTVAVKGAPLPNSGDYAESNIGLFSALPKISTISGSVGAGQGAVNVTGVAKGLTMVGIAYKNTPTMMLGYILIQVNDPAASSQNNIEEIKDIGDTLERLIADPSQPTAVEQATVNAVASEITKLPDAAKEQLKVDDVKKIDALQQTVQNITVTPSLPVVSGAPTLARNFTVVGAAVSSGAAANDTVTITATPKPVSGEVKMELDLTMTVGGGEQQLKSPLFFEMELPAGIDPTKLKISHILAGGSTEEISFTASGQTVSFKLDSFSGLQFIVASGGGTPTPPPSGGDGGSGGSSSDDGYDFWMQVKDKIEKADDGDVIKANAKDYDKMPESVMDTLRKNDDVSLVITWNGKTITIPAGKAQKNEPGRIYWPLSKLAELYAGIAQDTVLKLEPQNPETGGPGKYIPVTGGGELITLEAPAPAMENTIPDATDKAQAITPAQPKAITPPDAGFEADAFVGTPDAKAARSMGTAAFAGLAMLLAVLCGSGVWFWKRRTQRE